MMMPIGLERDRIGIIGIIIGLSYILSPEEVISEPSSGPEESISATISVGPGSFALSGQF